MVQRLWHCGIHFGKCKSHVEFGFFGWRVLRGIVPLKAILTNRHIGSNGACPICHQGAEDIRNILFLCVHAKEVWMRLGMLQLVEDAVPVDRSGSIIFEHLLTLPDDLLMVHSNVNFKQALMVGAWYLWWIRRRMTHDEPVPPSWRWPISILSIASNFQNSLTSSHVMRETKWCKADPRYTKLNVNAAFFSR